MNSYFVRSGIITPPNTNGTLRYVGFGGWDWSSRGSSTRDDGATFPGSYYFSFSNSVVPSRGPHDRWYGFPLRCLSTVLGM
jgi:hypothetical protein